MESSGLSVWLRGERDGDELVIPTQAAVNFVASQGSPSIDQVIGLTPVEKAPVPSDNSVAAHLVSPQFPNSQFSSPHAHRHMHDSGLVAVGETSSHTLSLPRMPPTGIPFVTVVDVDTSACDRPAVTPSYSSSTSTVDSVSTSRPLNDALEVCFFLKMWSNFNAFYIDEKKSENFKHFYVVLFSGDGSQMHLSTTSLLSPRNHDLNEFTPVSTFSKFLSTCFRHNYIQFHSHRTYYIQFKLHKNCCQNNCYRLSREQFLQVSVIKVRVGAG